MAQQQAKTVRVALNKGFVSEATALTYPEDATKDELNVGLDRKGGRFKRSALVQETGGAWFTRPLATVRNNFVWEFPGGRKDRSFLVVQEDKKLLFFNMRRRPMSAVLPEGILDLAAHFRAGTAVGQMTFAVAKGLLVVVAENMNSLAISYDGLFQIKVLSFRMRDFEWLTSPKSDLISETTTETAARLYDSYNTGWTKDLLQTFRNNHGGRLPALNKYVWSSKNSGGGTSVSSGDWAKIDGGSTLISNGRFILDLYTMDREAASGVPGLNAASAARGLGPEQTRFTTAAGYAGRFFFAGLTSQRSSGRIYFSQVVETVEEIGEFYSKNDPTAEYLSDLLDTDGGYVDIPEAEGIHKLHVFGTSLLVFASNGVWAISGVDDVFRATDYTVNSLGRTDTTSVSSFVSAEGRPYWWSDTGIMTVSISEFKNLELVSVSDNTVKSFFQSIPKNTRDKAIGAFDSKNRQVFWLYGDTWDEENYQNALILDENHGAFLKWRFSPGPAGETVVGLFYNRYSPLEEVDDVVVDETYDIVVTENWTEVLSEQTIPLDTDHNFLFMVRNETGQITFAYLQDGQFYDWGVAPYDAYIETGYSFMGDISTYKNTPQLSVLLKRSETGFAEEGFVRPSSLYASVYWDGSRVPAYRPQQVYHFNWFSPDVLDFAGEFEILQSKIIPRGRGRNMRIRFEAEEGKDFYLIGFETLDAKNSRV